MPSQSRRILGLGILLAGLAGGYGERTAHADEAIQQRKAAIQQIWQITDTVLTKHVEPQTRQEMLLGGLRAALAAAKLRAPADLSKQVSGVTTQEQFLALAQRLFPEAAHNPAVAEAFLHGLMERIPGRGEFLPQKEFLVQEQLNNNRYIGTGIQIRRFDKEARAQIVQAFYDSPAKRAGILDNDVILKVDGDVIEGENVLRRVVDLLRGPEGSSVTVVVRQPEKEEERTCKITRGVIPIPSVAGYRRVDETSWDHRILEGVDICYVRLESIRSSTLAELRKLEPRLKAEGFKGIILDQRFAGAGQMHDTALLADGLVDGGKMWQTRDVRNQVRIYEADADCLFRDWPMAVLIHPGNAGHGTEWLAAALKGNRKATLVGEAFLSEGFVRDFVKLPDEKGALLMPVARVELADSFRADTRAPLEAQASPGMRWRIAPDHEVRLERPVRDAIMNHQFAPPAMAIKHKGQAPPKDPQLEKAIEVIQAKLKSDKKAASESSTRNPPSPG